MNLADFHYDLPPERIAQRPPAVRTDARLLVHDIGADRSEHRGVSDLPDDLRADDLVVFNDTRVLSTRFFGRRASGGRVELLLLEAHATDAAIWTALAHPARKLKPGEEIALEGGALSVRMLERPMEADGRPAKTWLVELRVPDGSDVRTALETHGHMPLPPYIERSRDDEELDALDRERYQTVFAAQPGAVAAPTAGLHFTRELLERIDATGARRATVTLHVGHGTFAPLEGPGVEGHTMHAERYVLTPEVAEAVRATRQRGGRVVAIGTTSVRVLEACAIPGAGEVRAQSGATRLFLYPGKPFHVVDAMFTNFHLPASSLLLLVSAFAGRERILRLYAEAIRERYRFFSYGDAMLLSNRPRG